MQWKARSRDRRATLPAARGSGSPRGITLQRCPTLPEAGLLQPGQGRREVRSRSSTQAHPLHQEPTSCCGPVHRPGHPGTQHSPLRAGMGLPRKNSATCSRDAGEAVRSSSSCSRPSPYPSPHSSKALTSFSSEGPADEGPTEFPAQPPKCWRDQSASGPV